jgi:hypothetical protein
VRYRLDPLTLLRLQTWLSPAFPTGGYSWSHGLEQAVEDGHVADRAGLVAWVAGTLRFGAGMRPDEIAEVVGKKSGAVRWLQHAALEKLRTLLSSPYHDHRVNGNHSSNGQSPHHDQKD